MWPAVNLIARRIQDSVAGWVVVIILAVSVWEIEMAHFLRMYGPVQAVFTWHLVFYLRYTVDHDSVALRWSVCGPGRRSGEYVAKGYIETKRRQRFLIREMISESAPISAPHRNTSE